MPIWRAWLRLPLALTLLLLPASPGRSQNVNVTCYSNRDGSLSCQRLSDSKWFTCVASLGRTSTCQGSDGEAITCTRTGGGVSSCTASTRARTGFEDIPGLSVFGF